MTAPGIRATSPRADRCRRRPTSRVGGFTLLEVLVALVLLGIVSATVVGTFGIGLRAWKHGQDALDNLQRSSVVGDAVLRCLQGLVFSLENRDFYGLFGEDGSDGEYDTDTVSFVTRSHRLRPDAGPGWSGPLRLTLFIEESEWGDSVLSMSVENPFVLESADQPETIPLTRYVRGLNIRYLDPMTGEWLDEWETPPSDGDPEAPILPGSVEVTLALANVRPGQPNLVVTRVADIPIATTAILDSQNRTKKVTERTYREGGSRSAGGSGRASARDRRREAAAGGRGRGREPGAREGAGGGRGSAAGGMSRGGGGRTVPVRIGGGTGGGR